MCITTFIYVYNYIYIYVYNYIYIFTYIYMYIYTHCVLPESDMYWVHSWKRKPKEVPST